MCLGLNYVVKKINEAKIEERFIRMLQKASTTQSTQVNGPLIAVETGKTAQQLSPPGISLVFNQEENRRKSDPLNLITKTAKDKKFEVLSYKSMETINNILSIPSDDRTESDSMPVKKIEFERVAAKATSSHILTEKVLFKNNKFGHRAVKENSTITTKSDSYVNELIITVKNNQYGHVAGIGTLPLTRKDCNSSVLVAENETGRIISRKSSPSVHTDNVIQDFRIEDVPAKENAVKKESGHNTAEGTTSNEPNDSAVLTNIYTGQMVTNSARNIEEVTVKKPTVDKKCFIKKSVNNILSKIANLTNKNVDLRREKSARDKYVVKHSLSLAGSSRNMNVTSYLEKKESSVIAAKKTFSNTQSDRVGENCTITKRASEPIVAKETSPRAEIERKVNNFFSIKMSVAINAAKPTPTRTQSDITVSKYFAIKRSESGSVAVRRKDPVLLQEASHTRSDDDIAEISLDSMCESRRISVKANSLTDIVLKKNNEDTELDILAKKTEDSTMIAEIADTSKTINDDPVKEENVINIILNKPSSST